MAAIPDSIKIKLEIDTTEVDEAIEKVKQLNELMEKHVKVQKQDMNIPMFTGEITWDSIQTGTLAAPVIVAQIQCSDKENWIKELSGAIDKRLKAMNAEMKDKNLYKEDESHKLAHVSIKRENSITKIVLDGEELKGVSGVLFTQKAGEPPILKLELICEQVSIDSPVLLHVPDVYKNHSASKSENTAQEVVIQEQYYNWSRITELTKDLGRIISSCLTICDMHQEDQE